MIVNGVAYHRLSLIGSPSGRCIGQSLECTERTVKYMANNPAKNISSLDSQTIVPTLTRFGRVSECTRLDSKRGALAVDVTVGIIAVSVAGGVGGVGRVARLPAQGWRGRDGAPGPRRYDARMPAQTSDPVTVV